MIPSPLCVSRRDNHSFEQQGGVKLGLLDDFLLPGEVVLVSCCNLGALGSRYSLAWLTAEGVSWLNLDDFIDPSTDTGLGGVVATERNCFFAVQGRRPRIVSLGRDMRVMRTFDFRYRKDDPHSLAVRDGALHIALTGRNQVVSIRCEDGSLAGEEEVRFTGALGRKDVIHLNSVCFADEGAMLVSMFGTEPDAAVRHGALVNATHGTTIRSPLLDPHSLTYLGDGVVAYCESLAGAFCLLNLRTGTLRQARLSGYTRGCTFTGRHFIVGSSRRRPKSRSSGSAKSMPSSEDPHGNPWQRSSLYFLNPDLSIARRLDFTPYAPEIFDVVYVGTRFAAARLFRDAAARRLDALYDEIHLAGRPIDRNYYVRAR